MTAVRLREQTKAVVERRRVREGSGHEWVVAGVAVVIS